MVSAKFTQLYDETRTIQSGPAQDDLLKLYAYAKIALKKDIAATAKPGMFDMAGKYKYNTWQRYVNEGLSPEEAEKQYIELAEKLIATYKN